MSKTTKHRTFAELALGDTFDFVGPDPMMNSFYRKCRKTSARGYRDDAYVAHKIGSIKCSVYHVNESCDA